MAFSPRYLLRCCRTTIQTHSSASTVRHPPARQFVIPRQGRTPKWLSAEKAVASIESNTDIYVHAHASTPTELLEALADRVESERLNNIRPSHIILQGHVPWSKRSIKGIRSNCLFICGNLRKRVAEGTADYIPVFLSECPRLFNEHVLNVDVALITVSPPDSRGFCTMGVDVDCSVDAAKNAKHIIAIVNPSMPRTFGDSVIHVSHIDTLVATERPIYSLPEPAKPSEVEVKIGKIIAENLVDNGATLQLGIGAIPDSTLLAMDGHSDLGIHTELMSDGVIRLMKKGIINNSKKAVFPGKVVTSFAFGTKDFYQEIDNNPTFHFASCGWTNQSDVIRSNSKMTCINSALEIDLTGQIVSDSIGSTFYSGFGGQVDFMTAAPNCHDGKGKAIIAIPSQTTKGKAKIVPFLQQGAGVVTTRGHVRYVVTEYGIAQLFGKNVRQRAAELIRIAHPDDREELEMKAYERLRVMPSL